MVFSLLQCIGATSVAAILFSVLIATYRLFFHPLAAFPGPRLAAITHLYEVAWDYFGYGAYLFEIERMHEKYGPIVRINPIELSIRDPDFYNEVYVTGNVRRTEALPSFGDGMDFNGSHGMTVDHDLHRRRRKPMEPFFSRKGVTSIEPTLQELVGLMCYRLNEFKGTGKVIRLDHVFSALAGDLITNICVEDPAVSFLQDPEFTPDWFNLFHTLIRSMPVFMNFPWIIKLVRLIPSSILMNMDPRSQMFRDWRNMSVDHIKRAKEDKATGNTHIRKTSSFKCDTVFDQLVNSDMPDEELSVERLASEAQVLMGAGTVTTARSMDHLAFHIMNNEAVRKRLEEELASVMPNFPTEMPSWQTLEQLPFLQACLKEGLRCVQYREWNPLKPSLTPSFQHLRFAEATLYANRLSHGIMHRLPRCSPDVALQYQSWTIPKGTPVGMSAYFMHTDPSVYPEPFLFSPDRWLNNPSTEMRRNFVPFAKGSRGCLGINLAYAEMSLVMAALFCPKGPKLKLFETTEQDADPACAFLLPLPRLDSKGIRVMVE